MPVQSVTESALSSRTWLRQVRTMGKCFCRNILRIKVSEIKQWVRTRPQNCATVALVSRTHLLNQAQTVHHRRKTSQSTRKVRTNKKFFRKQQMHLKRLITYLILYVQDCRQIFVLLHWPSQQSVQDGFRCQSTVVLIGPLSTARENKNITLASYMVEVVGADLRIVI